MARIIELAGHSAAYGGRLLAELGHDVIRVEPPEGDALRRLGPFLGEQNLENGAYHQFLNAGKRSFTRLGSLKGLLATADVFIGEAPLNISDEELADVNPTLVVVRVEDHLPEICTYSRSGLLALTGQPDGRPMLMGGHAAYAATGTFIAVAVLSGLLASQAAGEGQIIDVSAEDCLAVLGEQAVIAETITGEKFERRGYRGAITAISGAFRCADGYAMLSVPPTPENWRRFMEWVGDPILSENEALADEAERRARQDFVIDRLERWTQLFGKEDLVVQSQARHTPAAPVSTPGDLTDDPQLTARGFLRREDIPGLGSMLFPLGPLATMSGVQLAPAPRLGQHDDQILSEVG